MPHCGGCSCTPPAVLGVLSHCWERPKEPSGSSAAPGWEGCRGGSPHPTGAPQEPDAELQEGKLLDRVYNTYLLMHTHQTVDFVRKKVRPPPAPGHPFPPVVHRQPGGDTPQPPPPRTQVLQVLPWYTSLLGGHPLPTWLRGGSRGVSGWQRRLGRGSPSPVPAVSTERRVRDLLPAQDERHGGTGTAGPAGGRVRPGRGLPQLLPCLSNRRGHPPGPP